MHLDTVLEFVIAPRNLRELLCCPQLCHNLLVASDVTQGSFTMACMAKRAGAAPGMMRWSEDKHRLSPLWVDVAVRGSLDSSTVLQASVWCDQGLEHPCASRPGRIVHFLVAQSGRLVLELTELGPKLILVRAIPVTRMRSDPAVRLHFRLL